MSDWLCILSLLLYDDSVAAEAHAKVIYIEIVCFEAEAPVLCVRGVCVYLPPLPAAEVSALTAQVKIKEEIPKKGSSAINHR